MIVNSTLDQKWNLRYYEFIKKIKTIHIKSIIKSHTLIDELLLEILNNFTLNN